MLTINIVTVALLFGALVLSLAQFASKAIGGDEVLNSMRVLRMAGWTIGMVWALERCAESSPGVHPMHLVVALLAFTEIVTGLRRFRDILNAETYQCKYGRPRATPNDQPQSIDR